MLEHLLSKEYAQQRAEKITDEATIPEPMDFQKAALSILQLRMEKEIWCPSFNRIIWALARESSFRDRHRASKPRRRFLTRSESSECA